MRRAARIVPVLLLGFFSQAGAALAATEAFHFDKNHTLVGFRVRHLVSRVEGRFKDFSGTITLDRQNPSASKVELTIQAASIDTGVENRDKDLRSANFFEVERFPTITFTSSGIEPKGADTWEVTGDLTMKGVTKSVTLTVKSTGFVKLKGVEKAGFEVTGKLDRRQWGIVWNRPLEGGGTMLSDDVDLNIQVEANKPEADAAKGEAGKKS
jgi:polyisoprenoid-binding protein YceI